MKRLFGNESAYSESIIPAGTYKNQTEDIKTMGVTAVLVAKDSVSPEMEEAVLSILTAQNEELKEISFGVTEIVEMSHFLILGLKSVLNLDPSLRIFK